MLGLAPVLPQHGPACVLHHALASGGTVVALARFDLEVMLRAMETHGVQQALVAPPLAGRARPTTRRRRPSTCRRCARSAAAGAGRRRARAGRRRAARLPGRQGYGITEAVAAGRGLPARRPVAHAARDRSACWCAAPRPGSSTRRRDAAGERGRRAVGARPQLMRAIATTRGHCRDDRRRRLAAHRGPRPHRRGRLHLPRRPAQELIKVRGFQVAPAELEAVLVTHPAVADAQSSACPTSATASARRRLSSRAARSTTSELTRLRRRAGGAIQTAGGDRGDRRAAEVAPREAAAPGAGRARGQRRQTRGLDTYI